MEEIDDDAMATEQPPLPSPPPPHSPEKLSELIHTLDHASHLARQLPISGDDSDHHRLILSALHSAYLSLSSFLSPPHHHRRDSPAGNSASFAAADDDAMSDGEEMESRDSTMERMEEKMRDSLYIQNKRPKRPLSPSSAAEQEREGFPAAVSPEFDPHRSRIQNLDLVYQFHG